MSKLSEIDLEYFQQAMRRAANSWIGEPCVPMVKEAMKNTIAEQINQVLYELGQQTFMPQDVGVEVVESPDDPREMNILVSILPTASFCVVDKQGGFWDQLACKLGV